MLNVYLPFMSHNICNVVLIQYSTNHKYHYSHMPVHVTTLQFVLHYYFIVFTLSVFSSNQSSGFANQNKEITYLARDLPLVHHENYTLANDIYAVCIIIGRFHHSFFRVNFYNMPSTHSKI